MPVELSSTTDLTKMTVVQLREHLKSRALPASGTKSELIERLKESLTNEEKILETDDGVLKGSAEAPVATGVTTEEDVLGPQSSPKKTDGDANIAKDDEKMTVVEDSKKEKEGGKKKDDEETLDAKTKRALRFGLPLSNEELKRKRAERFGMNAGGSGGDAVSEEERKRRRLERFGAANGGGAELSNEELLKKRAERFGLEFGRTSDTTSKRSSIGDVEKASLEALERRAKRFGICSEQAEAEMKKMRRAERFGLNKS
ncbi:unnamed protein product [Toxocara canis]|uniref:SAP domain-containing protein n=2 Tax=Toxocara canis TaxID=6265 RepID=A0A183UL20_TOXCA|nr:unnamed protein product [Toxocara canis]